MPAPDFVPVHPLEPGYHIYGIILRNPDSFLPIWLYHSDWNGQGILVLQKQNLQIHRTALLIDALQPYLGGVIGQVQKRHRRALRLKQAAVLLSRAQERVRIEVLACPVALIVHGAALYRTAVIGHPESFVGGDVIQIGQRLGGGHISPLLKLIGDFLPPDAHMGIRCPGIIAYLRLLLLDAQHTDVPIHLSGPRAGDAELPLSFRPLEHLPCQLLGCKGFDGIAVPVDESFGPFVHESFRQSPVRPCHIHRIHRRGAPFCLAISAGHPIIAVGCLAARHLAVAAGSSTFSMAAKRATMVHTC